MARASSSSRQAHADPVASQLGTRLCSGTVVRRSGPSSGRRSGSLGLLSSRTAAPREICSFTPVPRAIRSSSPAPFSLMTGRLPLSARFTPVSPGLLPTRQAAVSHPLASTPTRRTPPRHDSIRPTTLDCMRDYRERLYAPLAWWLLAIPTVLILGATLYAGLPWPWPIVIFGGLAAGCAALLIAFGRGTLTVGDGTLRAGAAVLPLGAISEVVALDEKQTRRRTFTRDPTSRNPYTWPSIRRPRGTAGSPTG